MKRYNVKPIIIGALLGAVVLKLGDFVAVSYVNAKSDTVLKSAYYYQIEEEAREDLEKERNKLGLNNSKIELIILDSTSSGDWHARSSGKNGEYLIEVKRDKLCREAIRHELYHIKYDFIGKRAHSSRCGIFESFCSELDAINYSIAEKN